MCPNHLHVPCLPNKLFYGSTQESWLMGDKNIYNKSEKFVWMEMNFVLVMNRGCNPSGLGSRLIVVVRQWVTEILAVHNF